MRILSDKRALIESLRTASRVAAPFFLIGISTLRSYLETVHFTAIERYSYYRSAHHVAWFCAALLLVMLAMHLVTKVPVKRLVWMCYGMIVILLPVMWAWLTGNNLALEYHSSDPGVMVRDIFTFVWTMPNNRPVILDGGLAAIGLFFLGWFYTRRWICGVYVVLAAFVIINVLGMVILGPAGTVNPMIKLGSDWGFDTFVSALFLLVAFIALVAVMWRAELFSQEKRTWAVCAFIGLFGWAAFSVMAYYVKWFPQHYDAFMAGFPMGFCIFLLARVAMWMAGRPGNNHALALMLLALACQAAIFAPIYAGTHEGLSSQVKQTRVWTREREPFSRLRLLGGKRFDMPSQAETPPGYDPYSESGPESPGDSPY